MPTYDYKCTECGKTHEVIQKMSDEPIKICPNCKKETLRRSYTSVSLQFKGSGFYGTDYNNPPSTPGHCGKNECGCKGS